jgi:RNA polymerase sigma factor (TIGR02999 family)
LLLQSIREGDESAYTKLFPLIYDDLQRLAASRLRRERPNHTLEPAALVNEAYLRLVQGEPTWQERAHFFAAAAEAMRRVLVDHARRRSAQKRGGKMQPVTFNSIAVASDEPDVDILALDEALTALAEHDPRLNQVVHLRYFVGLSITETAELLHVSPATVKRDWTYARAWLYEHMEGSSSSGNG